MASTDESRTLIDSGAARHVLRLRSQLAKTMSRLKCHVQTATGQKKTLTEHGPISIFARNAEGKDSLITDVGQGFVFEELLYSLLSVSELCKHGCTVIFKPEHAHIILPDGQNIPLEQEAGLYFVPNRAPTCPSAWALAATKETRYAPDPNVKEQAASTCAILARAGWEEPKSMTGLSVPEKLILQELRKLKKEESKCIVTRIRKHVRHSSAAAKTKAPADQTHRVATPTTSATMTARRLPKNFLRKLGQVYKTTMAATTRTPASATVAVSSVTPAHRKDRAAPPARSSFLRRLGKIYRSRMTSPGSD